MSYNIDPYYNGGWYEEWYGLGRKEEEAHYFVQNHNDGHLEGVCKELLKED